MTLSVLLLIIALVLFLIVAFAGLPHVPVFIKNLGNRVNLQALAWALVVIVFIMDRV